MKTLFYNGNIISLSDIHCEAVLIDEDKIIGMGKYSDLYNKDCDLYNLQGKTLIPSFLDAHSHLSSYANSFLQVSLEKIDNLLEMKNKILAFIKENNMKSDDWVIANSFEPSDFSIADKIDRFVLDSISKSNPIVIQNKNGHNGIFNSKAIDLLKIKTDTGILEEDEYMRYIEKVPMGNFDLLIKSYEVAQKQYLKHGITTIQEGIVVKPMLPIYKYLIKNNKIFIDTVIYPNLECFNELKNLYPQAINNYYNHVKIGGIKIILDGSPQSKTAWMLTNYKDSNECGYGVLSDADVCKAIEVAINENVQLIAHCNGDAAIKQFLDNLERYDLKLVKKIKPVIIHAQLLNLEQLSQVKRLGAIPSFFIAHVFHFGDIHIQNFGIERASLISPANSTLKNDIVFTFHQDTPVIEPNIIETLWCATNRLTKNNILLGSNEKIDVLSALKAQTINVAIQYGEENLKGNIDIGKKANFVILDKNILNIDTADLNNLKIVATVHNGKVLNN